MILRKTGYEHGIRMALNVYSVLRWALVLAVLKHCVATMRDSGTSLDMKTTNVAGKERNLR